MRLAIELEFFNSSEVLRGFRNVRLAFYHESTHHLFDCNVTNGSANDIEIKFLNLPPKTMLFQSLVCNIEGEKLEKYRSLCDSLKIKCEDHKGKTVYFDLDNKINK